MVHYLGLILGFVLFVALLLLFICVFGCMSVGSAYFLGFRLFVFVGVVTALRVCVFVCFGCLFCLFWVFVC